MGYYVALHPEQGGGDHRLASLDDAQGQIEVKGYALPRGSDGPIRVVEVSADGGSTWKEADLSFGGYGDLKTAESRRKIKWAWCLWSAKINVERGSNQNIVSRATDYEGNTQQEESEWNLRGVGYNGWGRVANVIVI